MLWNEKFAFDIPEIDQQHEKLFGLLDRLDVLAQDIRDGFNCISDIHEVLEELQSYTIYHFEDEERMLHEAEYEFLEEHVREHEAFIDKIQENLESDLDFEQKEVINDLYRFLFNWVSNHILNTDVKYVSVLKAKAYEKK